MLQSCYFFFFLFQSFWVNGLLWKGVGSIFGWLGKRFQSFWVNGLLWKIFLLQLLFVDVSVSILLGQWITLEDIESRKFGRNFRSFNPSGSMDYFGSSLKKHIYVVQERVSILLGQWITLEVGSGDPAMNAVGLFQSFWVNGLLWKIFFFV